jgi:uncharacterized GH25 family protein
MTKRKYAFPLALALAAVLSSTLQAHRMWLLPSSTVLSGNDPWVTVDAAVSNELFYFDHVPLRLANLAVIGPDGAAVEVQNASTGKYRSTFDVKLAQPGTYRIAVANNTVFAAWEENGQPRSWRGTPEAFLNEAPDAAKAGRVARMNSRVEVFVTSGRPTARSLQPAGRGLELVPVTHPNDLVAGEEATFAMLLDGKPAANLEITIIPGGIRYRDQLQESRLRTGEDGRFTVKWKAPGMYWLNATTGAAGGPGGRQPMGDRASYTATLEVLPQ